MCHAIEQVKHKKRGGLDLTYFDLKMIEIMIGLGLAKDVTDRYKDHPVGRPENNRIFHIRYGGKLLKPVVDISNEDFEKLDELGVFEDEDNCCLSVWT